MLDEIKLASAGELFSQIPSKSQTWDFELADAINEIETQKRIKALAKKNKTEWNYWRKINDNQNLVCATKMNS